MKVLLALAGRLAAFGALALTASSLAAIQTAPETAYAADDPVDMHVEQLDGSQFVYVVFHALDRDGFCKPPEGAVSLHPVLGLPVDFVIEAGDGIIIETSGGGATPGRSVTAIPTFSTAVNATLTSPVRSFDPLIDGLADECQAWIRVSQSIPGPLRVLVTVGADSDGGKIQYIADLERDNTVQTTLNFRWSLVTWQGANGMSPAEALKGAGGATDITAQVSAIYGWNAATQTWQAFFPSGAGIPGANNLTALATGSAYWTAINGPGPVVWSVVQ